MRSLLLALLVPLTAGTNASVAEFADDADVINVSGDRFHTRAAIAKQRALAWPSRAMSCFTRVFRP